jgi:hypothetical protein
MSRIVGIVLVVVGVLLATSFIIHSSWLLIGLALVFGIGANAGWIGRWGMGLAGLLAVLGLVGLVFGAVAGIFVLAIRLAPLLLVIYGISVLIGKPRRRS